MRFCHIHLRAPLVSCRRPRLSHTGTDASAWAWTWPGPSFLLALFGVLSKHWKIPASAPSPVRSGHPGESRTNKKERKRRQSKCKRTLQTMVGPRASSVPKHVSLWIDLPGRIRGFFGRDDLVPGGSTGLMQLIWKSGTGRTKKKEKPSVSYGRAHQGLWLLQWDRAGEPCQKMEFSRRPGWDQQLWKPHPSLKPWQRQPQWERFKINLREFQVC